MLETSGDTDAANGSVLSDNTSLARTPQLTGGEYRALADFRRYLRRFLTFSEGITGAAGLQPSQYQALLAIRALSDAGPVTTSMLAEQLCLKLNSAVELTDRLIAAGLVTRSRAPADRRVTVLCLTCDGTMALVPLAADHLRHHRAHLPDLIASMARLLDLSAAS